MDSKVNTSRQVESVPLPDGLYHLASPEISNCKGDDGVLQYTAISRKKGSGRSAS